MLFLPHEIGCEPIRLLDLRVNLFIEGGRSANDPRGGGS
jgi:hypothetical protein